MAGLFFNTLSDLTRRQGIVTDSYNDLKNACPQYTWVESHLMNDQAPGIGEPFATLPVSG